MQHGGFCTAVAVLDYIACTYSDSSQIAAWASRDQHWELALSPTQPPDRVYMCASCVCIRIANDT